MRRSFLLFVLLVPFVKSQSQPITFIKNYVNGEFLGLFGEVIQTHDSGYATITVTDAGLDLIKSNKYGDTLWTKIYSADYTGLPAKVAEKNNGGYFILVSSPCGVITCATILNVDAGGNLLWSQSYNMDSTTFFSKIILDVDNRIFLGGHISYGVGGSEADEVLMKLDSSGDVLFQKTFVKSTYDFITSFRLSNSQDYYFMSSCDSAMNSFTRITRADSNGNIIWSLKIDSTYFLSFWQGMELSENRETYALVKKVNSSNQNLLTVVKVDSSGNLTWAENYFTQYYSATGRSITSSSSGNIAITGGIIDTTSNVWSQKIFFLLIDSAGNELSSVLFPEAFDGYSIYSTYDNGYIIGADDYGSGPTDSGFYLIKTDALGAITGAFDPNPSESQFRVYPNPSSGIFSINVSGERNSLIDFEVFNTLGQRINTFSVSNNNSFALDFSNHPDGIYFLTGKDQFKSYLGKIIISR